MKTFLGILAAPRESLESLRARPVWRMALLVTTFGFFVLLWLGGCWRDLSQALRLSSLLGPALVSPIAVGLVSLGTTILIYLIYKIVRGADHEVVRFKTLYAVNIHCGAVFFLGEIVNFLLMRLPWQAVYATPIRDRFPVGLDLLLLGAENPNLYLSIGLHATSIFIFWYLWVLSLGIRVVCGFSSKQSVAIVILLWCAMVAFALATAYVAGGNTTVRIQI